MPLLLKTGSEGQEVIRLQARLGGIGVDGTFGPLTEACVKEYQTAQGLQADGVAGWNTQVALGMPVRSGIDISHYQGTVDWAKVPRDTVQFVYAKATEGTDLVDSQYFNNSAGCAKARIPFGSYHFAHPQNDWRKDLDNFCKTVGFLNPTDLPPALDLEATGGLGAADLRNWAQNWLQGCQDRLGRQPVLYSSASFLTGQLGGCNGLGAYCTVWVAKWSGSTLAEPAVPATWPQWAFWQYSSKGQVAGISGDVDLDYAAGDAIWP